MSIIDKSTFEDGEPTHLVRRKQLMLLVDALNANERVDAGYAVAGAANNFVGNQHIAGDLQVTGSVAVSGTLLVTGSVYSTAGFVGDGSGLTNTGVQTNSHAALTNLAYATAGHTGFDSSVNAQFVSGNLVQRIIDGTGSLTRDHAGLTNLAYASSLHTGFAGTAVVNQFTAGQQLQAGVQVTGSVLVQGALYATSGMNSPRALTIMNVTGSMGVTWFRTPVTLTVSEAAYTISGASPSVTASILTGLSRASGLHIDSKRVVSATGAPEIVRAFVSTSIPSGSIVWMDVTGSVDGRTANLTCDLYF